jgi:hypothetical protein
MGLLNSHEKLREFLVSGIRISNFKEKSVREIFVDESDLA